MSQSMDQANVQALFRKFAALLAGYAATSPARKELADHEKAVPLASKDSYVSVSNTPLALLRAGCPDGKLRDGKKGLEAAQKANDLAKGPSELAAFGVAHAELGQFDKADQWQTKAIASAPAEENDQYQGRLKLLSLQTDNWGT